ncbi:tetratricopeptide repeat protein [Phytohabitans sp. ZYX-F-186]|uniref:Tetratricopeptide repeat protein n=1 Tax=Phytohabitans maris TaxID=3071409 RepID=A0ABU0ZPZ0_9ACTN|nr:tetratricopeptide repeat protein [Phytohabitans sp. ZYX-F-186]MDQ7909087.1 tetratricopeptide repeat protein [Phytohabitans sp. ZYX-F-186]
MASAVALSWVPFDIVAFRGVSVRVVRSDAGGVAMEPRFARRGFAAGVSTVLAILAGFLTNLATAGITWPVGAGLVVLAGGWVGVEAWRARDDRAVAVAGRSDSAGFAVVRRPQRSLAAPVGLLPPHIRGRDGLVAALAELVDAPDGRVHVLCGLGGCGKTTIALTVAQRATVLDRVWWISARDEATLATALVALAVDVGVPLAKIRQAGAGTGSLVDLIWRRLEVSPHRWLMVVDNADEPQLLAADTAGVGDGTGLVRGSRRGLVLVTTRLAAPDVWGAQTVLHRVGLLSDDDGGRVLRDIAPQAGTPDDARKLAARLGGLPLALRAAGRYLDSTRARLERVRTFADYLGIIDVKFKEAVVGSCASARRDVVVSTWDVSLDLLARQGLPQARLLMRLLGGFAAAPIPVGALDGPALFGSPALRHWAVDSPPSRRTVAAITARAVARLCPSTRYGKELHQRTVTALCDLGLIDLIETNPTAAEAACLATHPLVHDVSAAWLTEGSTAARAVRKTVAALLAEATKDRDPHDPNQFGWWPTVAPHLTHALSHHVAHLPRADRARLVNAADLTVLGLCRAGDFQTAHALATAALNVAVTHLPSDHPIIFKARHHLGMALLELGLHEQAEANYRTALVGRLRLLGNQHPETLSTRHNLAVTMYLQGKYAQAETELRTLRPIREQVEGIEHPHSLRTRHMLAEVLMRRGALAEAEMEFRSVLAVLERLPGIDHPDTLRTRSSLAEVLAEQEQYEQAETEFHAVLAGRRQILGEEHPFTLRTWCRLTQTQAQRGTREPDELYAQYRAIHTLQKQVLGHQHPDTAATQAAIDQLDRTNR